MLQLLIIQGTFVYVLGGSSEYMYKVDVASGQVVDSLFVGANGDVPNFIYMPSRTVNSGDVGYLINSGGFYGVPSIVELDLYGMGILSEYVLNDSLNPMQGEVVADTFYFTNYGKSGNGSAVYLFNNGSIADSIEVGIKPIGIDYCFGSLFVASKSGYLYRINPADRSKDSLLLDPTISNVGCDDQYIYVLATGVYGNDDARIYRVNPTTFTSDGSTDQFQNSYTLAVGDSKVYAATFGGLLYIIDKATAQMDSLDLGYYGVGGLDFYDGNLYISAGAWSGSENRVLVYNESSGSITGDYVVSSSDVGLGFLIAFDMTVGISEDSHRAPFTYRNGILYMDEPARVSIFDVKGRRLFSGVAERVDLRRFDSPIIFVRTIYGTYKVVKY